MEPVYVMGHRNPDTDSVVSAISYAALMNAVGEGEYIPCRLGHLNDETSFLLKHFGFEPPKVLNTVKTQVRDIEIDYPPKINASVPVDKAWEVMRKTGAGALPVVDDNNRLFGMVTNGAIAESDIESINESAVIDVPIFNVLSALEGRILNDDADLFDTISGDVMIALPSSNQDVPGMTENSIVICGYQPEVVQHALDIHVPCIILCQTDLAEKYRGFTGNTCMIVSPCDAYRTARLLYQAIPISRIAKTENIVAFHLDDYIDDVRDTVLQSRYRSYPVLDENDQIVGTLGRFHLLRPKKKHVVLVDHNEKMQSVSGLEQADIVTIIDHHRLADVQTGSPIFMRNEPVGSTTTIIATMYQEHGLMPSQKLAGLMASAILSDTVLFKSPTCTERDRKIAERLARIAGINLEALGREMFSIGISLDKPVSELIRGDFKEFHLGGHTLGISQIACLDTSDLMPRLDEFIECMNSINSEQRYDMFLLMLTDVLRDGTELVFLGDRDVIRMAFALSDTPEKHVFLEKVVSRKKQIVPALAALWG